MTRQRDFDRLARAWLDQGPDEAPDRVIDAVLQAAETTPQVRHPIRWPTWRSPTMNRLSFASLAAILTIVVGGGVLYIGSQGPTGVVATPPSPAPSATTSPSVSPPATVGVVPAKVPAELQGIWVGPPRSVPGMLPSNRYRIQISDKVLRFPGDEMSFGQLESSAAASGPDEFVLTSTTTHGGCQPGDTGHYQWATSPVGTTVDLTLVDDVCSNRAAALAGTWYHVRCVQSSNGCLGDLEAGTYASQYVAPRQDPTETWSPDWGALTYTVPDGWADGEDWPAIFQLTPMVDYDSATAGGPAPDGYHSIFLLTQPAAAIQAADCANTVDTSVPQTVAGLMGWITSRPGVKASIPKPITIGGRKGQYVDVSLAKSWTATCPDTATPVALYLVQTPPTKDGWFWGIEAGELQRLFLVDIGDGATVFIVIDSTHPDRYDQLVADAMPIIKSFQFK